MRRRGGALAAVSISALASLVGTACTALLGIDGTYGPEASNSGAVDGAPTTGTSDEGGSEDAPESGASLVDATQSVDGADGGTIVVATDAGPDTAFPANPGVVTAVTAGYFHACIRFASGYAMCWGRNEDFGELGNGTMYSTSIPLPAMGYGIQQLVAGAHDTCAILADGGECAGKGGLAELGDGVWDADVPYPVPTSAFPAAPIALTSGEDFTCAIVTGGDVYCVGNGSTGELGNGSNEMSATAVRVGLAHPAIAISSLVEHVCALLDDGSVWCWGQDASGQLGDGTPVGSTASSDTPVAVQGLPTGKASAICAGGAFSCAIIGNDANSTVWCWGDNSLGQLGNGSSSVTSSSSATQVTGLTGAASLSCGAQHACIGNDYAGGISCWGSNGSGQLGNASVGSKSFTPVPVTGVGSFPASLAAGGFFTCAMFSSPQVFCWGADDFGQLGNGTTSQSATTTLTPVMGIP